jgi:hypothetical protein
MVLHYGNDLALGNYSFSKVDLRAAGFDAMLCPPWAEEDRAALRGGLLPFPPSPLSLTSKVTHARAPTTHPNMHHSPGACAAHAHMHTRGTKSRPHATSAANASLDGAFCPSADYC